MCTWRKVETRGNSCWDEWKKIWDETRREITNIRDSHIGRIGSMLRGISTAKRYNVLMLS